MDTEELLATMQIADVATSEANPKSGGDRVDIVIEEMEEVTPKHPGGCGAVYWAGGTTAVCI